MKHETHNLLRTIKHRLPLHQQKTFARRMRARLAELDDLAALNVPTVAKYTIGGMLAGAVLDLIPGAEMLAGVDGFVDIGAAIGASVGVARSAEERRARERVRRIIVEELNHVMA